MWAAECNHLEITKVLLERGANPNIYDQVYNFICFSGKLYVNFFFSCNF